MALAVSAAALLAAPAALAHVERASYWPDPDSDTAGGVATGGGIPEARALFSALDEGAAGQTRVVCDGGDPLPYRADREVSREPVDKLEKKLLSLRLKLKDERDDKDRIKGKVKRVKRKLRRARAEYQAALDAELAARGAYRSQLGSQPSIEQLDAALASATANGYELRPSEGRVPVSAGEAAALRDFNARLLARCAYDEIQPAINDSGNNDRVVVMPGVYTEPTARAVESFPAPGDNPCEGMRELNDRGEPTALSYRYQFHCPNQQNLIAVMGREPKKNPDDSEFVPPSPSPTDPRRDGIPDDGPCIRCNMQLEGSGVSPDDVVVDSGRVESGNGAPMGSVKDVGIRIDRADGFVLRNMTFRHAAEHDIYSPETDGLLLERFKTYFNGHYGVLTFVAQHHLIQDCDAAGSGDAAIYPGSSGETGEQANPNIDADNPSTPHTESGVYSTEIRRCDMRHSNTGYSGTAGNSVWLHHNDFYDNAMGFVTDVFTAAGHPGFPQDSDLLEQNEFYSNNFNPYVENGSGDLAVCDSVNGEQPGPHGPDQGCTDVIPRIPAPVGTGIFLPGGNNNTIRNNHFWDNWRRGTMLFAVPDSLVCGPATADPPPDGPTNEQHGCDESEFNTSHRNEHYGNVMGRSPNHAPDPTWPASGANAADPNGLDFWWDRYLGNARNCWYDNVGPDGTRGTLTADPPLNPGGDNAPFAPAFLPGKGVAGNCSDSVGTVGPAQEAELVNCLGDYSFDTGTCDWFLTPTEP